eukprot:gene25234-30801_t
MVKVSATQLPPAADRYKTNDETSLATEAMKAADIDALWCMMGAEKYKVARMNYQLAWQIPATLVMSIAFSCILVLPKPDEINAVVQSSSTPGEKAEQRWRAFVAHLYVASMMLSGLLSIKSINDFLQDYLAHTDTPDIYLPEFIKYRKEWKDDKPCSIDIMKRWLRIPNYCHALWSSIRYLILGFLCAIYLLYGWSYLIAPSIFAVFYCVEYQRTCERDFKNCRNDFTKAKGLVPGGFEF